MTQVVKTIDEVANAIKVSSRTVNRWKQDGSGAGDHSNTQFGVLGLYAARKAGMRIPTLNMKRIIRHFTAIQNRDGGWGYNKNNSSTPQMTGAGTASLLIAGDRVFHPGVNCGGEVEYR